MGVAEIEIVREATAALSEAVSSRDLNGPAMRRALSFTTEDTEFRSLAVGQDYRGREGMRRWVAEMLEVFADVQPRGGEPREVGEYIVMPGRTSGRAAQSGVEIEWDWVWIGRVEDGLIREAGIYQTEAEALAAVGVSSG